MHRLLVVLALLAALGLPAGAGAASGAPTPEDLRGPNGGSDPYQLSVGKNGTRFALYDGRIRIKLHSSTAAVKRLVLGHRVIVSCDSARQVVLWPGNRDSIRVRFASAELGTTRKCAIRRLSGTPIDYANVLPSGSGPDGHTDY